MCRSQVGGSSTEHFRVSVRLGIWLYMQQSSCYVRQSLSLVSWVPSDEQSVAVFVGKWNFNETNEKWMRCIVNAGCEMGKKEERKKEKKTRSKPLPFLARFTQQVALSRGRDVHEWLTYAVIISPFRHTRKEKKRKKVFIKIVSIKSVN